MKTGWYTAGRASGSCDVPLGTLRRYVADFGEHFSEAARIPSRGRRFSMKDLELITKIRLLYNRGLSKSDVAKVLAGNWDPELPAQREIGQAAIIYRNASELHMKAVDLLQKTRGEISGLEQDLESYKTSFDIHSLHMEHDKKKGRDFTERVMTFVPVGLLASAVFMAQTGFWSDLAWFLAVVALCVGFANEFFSD